MIYDRNAGVKSILDARKNGDLIETLLNGSAMFSLVDGKITRKVTL